MTKQAREPKSRKTSAHRMSKRMSEGGFIMSLAVAMFVFFSLFTYHVNADLGVSEAGPSTNAGGLIGMMVANGCYVIFGYFSYAIPLFIGYAGMMILLDYKGFKDINGTTWMLRGVGFLLLLLGGCGLLSMQLAANQEAGIRFSGGVIGQLLMVGLSKQLNVQGAMLLLITFFLVGVTWVTGLSWLKVIESLGYYTLILLSYLRQALVLGFSAAKAKLSETSMPNPVKLRRAERKVAPKAELRMLPLLGPSAKPHPVVTPKATKTVQHSVIKKSFIVNGALPGLDLLEQGEASPHGSGYMHQELETLSRDVEQHLLDFGIQVDVVAVHPGPVITRFELQLAAGIKVSRLTALAKDLARSLSVTSVRIVEIIPGKTVVGIELPNPNRAMVCLSEVLSTDVYQQAHSPLTLALGVDIAGHPMIVDLAKMPHLLVAGTTGSGKSVGINAMILSLLFKSTPEEVRLIMVDPKMLELSVYDGIPHLLTPVVTDMKEAASALRWCVAEMERRYKLMAAVGVRNLAGFNTMVTERAQQGDPILDPLWKFTDSTDLSAPELQRLPYVVVIIDELADMMMVVGKKVEQLIARIAQKARAAGIHLILATQRPSVDVLTGLIKSNIPTRISFQVSSKIDSRTILDQQGAEQLLGHGDMLFLAPGTGAPLRVHGAFVDDLEVHRVADDWRARGTPQYIDDITQLSGDEGDLSEERTATEEADPLYDQAVEFVMQTRKASISSVQRRFKIGYNRAARLVEEMERTGLVGPMDGGYRDVLVNNKEYE